MRNLICASVVWLLSVGALANPMKTWGFNLSNGDEATLELNGIPTSCPNSSKILKLLAGTFAGNSDLCMDDPSQPDHLFGWFNLSDGEVASFYLYQGAEYTRILRDINEFGTPKGYPLGNGINGTCPSNANAFIMLSGDKIGDIPTYGYCLIPQ